MCTNEEVASSKQAQVPVIYPKLPTKSKVLQHRYEYSPCRDCSFLCDSLVVTDTINNLLTLYNGAEEYVHSIRLPGQPSGVTGINSTTVAVGVGEMCPETEIHIVDVYTKHLVNKFCVDKVSGEICFYDDYLYLGSSDGVLVMDLSGTIFKHIPTILKPFQIAVEKNRIYFANLNRLFCIDMCGYILWTFENSIIKGIRGLTIDEDGNIFMTGWTTNNIVVITPNGKHFRELASKSDRLICPTGLSYCKNTLVVCKLCGPILFELTRS